VKLFTRTPAETDEYAFDGTDEELLAEIERLEAANRRRPKAATERRLLRLRHVAGARIMDAAPSDPAFPVPDVQRLPEYEGALPEFTPDQVTPELLRAAILRDGCMLVRGLVDPADAAELAKGIERSFVARDRFLGGEGTASEYYEEFVMHPRFDPFLGRAWMVMGGGVYAADSARLSFALSETLHRARIPELASAYLGEPALMSVHKTTLRKAEPSVPGSWHQDGKFMGDVRALNLWVSLSHCGDTAPGMDLVPVRLDSFAETNTDEATIDTMVSNRVAHASAGERGVVRPIFEPGDALLFDELFLHQTASDPSMPGVRYALEVWMFGGSAFPPKYAPVAL
jgi:hypothetical protein